MIYSFGTFTFDAATLELRREDRLVRLEPQPARALALLLARGGELVTREEMRAAIWGDHTFVDYDRGLAYCVSQVRTALGDSGDNPRFVQTLPKRGFRFLAPVSAVGVQSVLASAKTHEAEQSTPQGTLPTALQETSPPASPTASPATPQTAAGLLQPPLRRAAGTDAVGEAVPASAAPQPPSTAPPSTAPHRQPTAGRRWPMVGAVAVVLLVAALLAGWWARADQSARMTTVAVSIFDNETGDPRFDGFVTGLSDLVVSRLAEIAPGRVGVIGNAAQLRQPRNIRNLAAIAASVAADYVILGQLQRQDGGLRFIVHVIRLEGNVHLSARRLTRPTLEVAGLGEEVVAEAERAVRAYLPVLQSPSHDTANR